MKQCTTKTKKNPRRRRCLAYPVTKQGLAALAVRFPRVAHNLRHGFLPKGWAMLTLPFSAFGSKRKGKVRVVLPAAGRTQPVS